MIVGRATAGGRTVSGEIDRRDFHVLEGDVFGTPRRTGETHALDAVTLRRPLESPRIVLQSGGFLTEGQTVAEGEHPRFIAKLVAEIGGPDDEIVVPPFVTEPIWSEVELGVVIGRSLRNATLDEARDAIWGFSCFNDACAGEFIVDIRTMTPVARPDYYRCKSIDTFAALGPWVRTDLDESDIDAGLEMTARVNGEVVGTGNTRRRKFPVSEVIRTLSLQTALRPGDVIALGCPAPAEAVPGDVVEIEIEGIGTLRNAIVAADV